MGYHLTYHPLSPAEFRSVFLDHLDDKSAYLRISEQFGLDEDCKSRLQGYLIIGKSLRAERPFPEGYGYAFPMVGSALRKYWYIRSGRHLPLLRDQFFDRYAIDWESLIPESERLGICTLKLRSPAGLGAFLSPEGVRQLRLDCARDSLVRQRMGQIFPGEWLTIFWAAADYAIEQGLGLVEAGDLYRPDRWHPTAASTILPAEHCDPDSIGLYNRECRAAIEAWAARRFDPKRQRARRKVLDRIKLSRADARNLS
ncbi:hypothetical protein [Lysobacter sp. Hz 25]|uniref:hypothetical protein n=1 Tax=Lysobacter sp. Hz 25 TaxID=3383698 RepID=UPI0038D399FE